MTTTTITTKAERIGNVQVQQSSLGLTLALAYGKARVTSNLLWYGDFTSVAVTTTTTSGGKGGSVKQKNTTWDYFVAFQAGLASGSVIAVPKVWVGKQRHDGGVSYSGTASMTELVTIPVNGKVKVAQWARLSAVTSVTLCQAPGDTADAALSSGTHYSTASGVISIDVATYPTYIGRVVRVVYTYDQTGLTSALTAASIPFFATGAVGQAAYGHMTSHHPTEALGYSETALISAQRYQLDDSAQLPNHNFEIIGRHQYPNMDDCDPADVVLDLLTHPTEGGNFPGSSIYGMETYSDYCRASGIFVAPVYQDQRELREIIDSMMSVTNSAVVWSEGVLKIKPYGDQAVTGNGVTYTPNMTPLYDLTTDDFLTSSPSDDPVNVERKTPADAFNTVTVEILNRDNDYNVEPITKDDLANVEAYGIRRANTVSMREICDVDVGSIATQLYLQRQLYVRNKYKFRLGWKYSLLEPMDLVTITEASLALNRELVRIILVEENEDGDLNIEAENVLIGTATAALYPSASNSGYIPDYSVDPGDVAAPAIFEPPIELTANGLEAWAAVSGSGASWGGCTAWVSFDGSSYKKMGRIIGGSRYGTLTSSPTSAVGQVTGVSLTGLGGELVSAAAGDSTNKATLSLVDDELVGYTTATLTGTNAYNITLADRGFYQTTAASHTSGQRFVRIDDRITKSEPLDYALVGQTLRFKFTSFNIYGSAEQSLADVAEYTYVVRGNMLALPPTTVASASYALEGFGVRLSWTTVADQDVDYYEIRYGGSAWADATVLARSKSSTYLWAVQTAGSYVVRVRARDVFGNYSTADATTTVVITTPTTLSPSASIVGQDVVLAWAVTTGSFNIDRYEIRHGASWAAGTAVAIAYTTTFREKAVWSGSKTYWVAGIDVAGNVGTAVSASLVVTSPGSVLATAEVIDNNVLLRWDDTTQTLPIVSYEIRRGASWGAGVTIGTGGTARFAAFFEQVGGTYDYWIQAVDSAGNTSTPSNVSAIVSTPPDYVLRASYDSTFSGTKSNCFSDGTYLYAALNVTETWTQHFTTNAWSSFSDAISAGKTYYFEPSATTGYYEETIDYGSALPATGIAATISYTTIAGAVTLTPTISTKLLVGDAWTDYAGQAQIVSGAFRYVKIRYDFTSTGGNDLIAISGINVKLSTKLRDDGGSGTAASGDSGGTTVSFNVAFIDVQSITVSALSTSARYAVYDFTDVPNPTSFKVLLFDTAGSRVSGDFSWTARGI